MDDTRFMRGFQRLGDLLCYRESFIDRDIALANPVSEGRPLDQLQHQRTSVAALFKTVDCRDVGMVQAGKNLRFSETVPGGPDLPQTPRAGS